MFPFYLFSSCVEWCGVKFSQIGFIGSNFMAAVLEPREVECLHILTGAGEITFGRRVESGEWWVRSRVLTMYRGDQFLTSLSVQPSVPGSGLWPRWLNAISDRNQVSPVILSVAGGARDQSPHCLLRSADQNWSENRTLGHWCKCQTRVLIIPVLRARSWPVAGDGEGGEAGGANGLYLDSE